MNHQPIVENSRRWLSGKFVTMKTKQRVSSVLQSISDHFVHYIVVQDKAGQPVAVVPTAEFIGWFENLKRSRFPGDVPPADLKLDQSLKDMGLKDFYRVDCRNGKVQVGRWREPRDILVTDGEQVLGVIPQEHFADWLEQFGLKRSLRN